MSIMSIVDVLEGKNCKGKIVDMGFWFDVPHITKQTLKILREKGASGVRLVLDTDLLREVLGSGKGEDKL